MLRSHDPIINMFSVDNTVKLKLYIKRYNDCMIEVVKMMKALRLKAFFFFILL